jgi:hypothetical protein
MVFVSGSQALDPWSHTDTTSLNASPGCVHAAKAQPLPHLRATSPRPFVDGDMGLANGRCVFLAIIDSETGLTLHHGAALRERAQGRCRCLRLGISYCPEGYKVTNSVVFEGIQKQEAKHPVAPPSGNIRLTHLCCLRTTYLRHRTPISTIVVPLRTQLSTPRDARPSRWITVWLKTSIEHILAFL